MQPLKYTCKDVLFFSKNHKMIVYDKDGQEIGAVIRTHDNEVRNESVRKGSFYAFEDENETLQTSISVKKQGWKSLEGYSYHLYDYQEDKVYDIQDVKWASFVYFHIKGSIQSMKFEAYQDWDGSLILKSDKKKYAAISFNEITFIVTFKIMDHPNDFLVSPEFLTQIYCMYRLYDMESKVIEELLF
ncbi:hypothetical protein [Oceanobacillus polygoni]|uniref:Uncharacterized protein n=1 Tax=Oceanobacillus polygoni TaxID=1235259 RepID=A0A9X0YW33_9BACI|nr:hypothetical protein [Oceanobacillus polygoni]MBP2079943.1 hypothetical protein [Oceanobacillus polygoni]